jgi:hypothetical protein
MSASLIVLIPLVLVGLVAGLCFIGCVLPTSGLPGGPYQPGPYQTAITQTGGIQALWPLNDSQLGTLLPITAADIAPKPSGVAPFNGTYQGTLNSSFELGQPSIVPGDTSSTPACASFSGTNGFVSVTPFHQQLNPAQQPSGFTVEAWVQPGWASTAPQVQRAVVVSANTPAGAGWGLLANANNLWEADVGTGAGNFSAVKSTQSVLLPDVNSNNSTYLAMVLDNTGLLTLWVGTASGGLVPTPASQTITFVQEQSAPPPPQQSTATPLFIGMGHPELTSGMFPFTGSIQDVAFYNVALDPQTIMSHFNLGITPGSDDT